MFPFLYDATQETATRTVRRAPPRSSSSTPTTASSITARRIRTTATRTAPTHTSAPPSTPLSRDRLPPCRRPRRSAARSSGASPPSNTVLLGGPSSSGGPSGWQGARQVCADGVRRSDTEGHVEKHICSRWLEGTLSGLMDQHAHSLVARPRQPVVHRLGAHAAGDLRRGEPRLAQPDDLVHEPGMQPWRGGDHAQRLARCDAQLCAGVALRPSQVTECYLGSSVSSRETSSSASSLLAIVPTARSSATSSSSRPISGPGATPSSLAAQQRLGGLAPLGPRPPRRRGRRPEECERLERPRLRPPPEAVDLARRVVRRRLGGRGACGAKRRVLVRDRAAQQPLAEDDDEQVARRVDGSTRVEPLGRAAERPEQPELAGAAEPVRRQPLELAEDPLARRPRRRARRARGRAPPSPRRAGSRARPRGAPRAGAGAGRRGRRSATRRAAARASRSARPPSGSTCSPPPSGRAIALTVKSRVREVVLDAPRGAA